MRIQVFGIIGLAIFMSGFGCSKSSDQSLLGVSDSQSTATHSGPAASFSFFSEVNDPEELANTDLRSVNQAVSASPQYAILDSELDSLQDAGVLNSDERKALRPIFTP